MGLQRSNMEKDKKQPLQARAVNTKKLIIEKSKELFLKKGYKKTNTILIAKEAKISVGIVYSYFKDKDELLELWLNSLLERCDEYFYDQFKLLNYEVELPFIISNIIEKISEYFLSSPLLKEKKDQYLINTLNNFFEKAKKIFIKCCYDAGILFKNQNETSHIILQLIIDYNNDMSYSLKNINKEALKTKYVNAICALLK